MKLRRSDLSLNLWKLPRRYDDAIRCITGLLQYEEVFAVLWQETPVGDKGCQPPLGNVTANTYHMWRDSHWMPCFRQEGKCRCVCVWVCVRHELTSIGIPHVQYMLSTCGCTSGECVAVIWHATYWAIYQTRHRKLRFQLCLCDLQACCMLMRTAD